MQSRPKVPKAERKSDFWKLGRFLNKVKMIEAAEVAQKVSIMLKKRKVESTACIRHYYCFEFLNTSKTSHEITISITSKDTIAGDENETGRIEQHREERYN